MAEFFMYHVYDDNYYGGKNSIGLYPTKERAEFEIHRPVQEGQHFDYEMLTVKGITDLAFDSERINMYKLIPSANKRQWWAFNTPEQAEDWYMELHKKQWFGAREGVWSLVKDDELIATYYHGEKLE